MIITFIGGGNMAGALIGGMLKKGFDARDIRVVEIIASAREKLAGDFGVACYAWPEAAVPGSDVVVLAVKPQQMREVARSIGPHVGTALVLSIAAGIRLVDLKRWIGGTPTMARCMPNTPALIGMGVTGLYADPTATPAQRAALERILSAAGPVVLLDSETALDPVTALSGSGPAYVFYLLEAMQRAGVEMGLSAKAARELSIQTVRGAAELASRTEDPADVLRARVTSKGGTTERAIATMEMHDVKHAIVRAILEANARAAELAAEFGRDS